MVRVPIYAWMAIAFALIAQAVDNLHAGEKERIPVGVCLSLSGDFAEFGKIYLAGVQLRLDEYEQSDESAYAIDLIVCDDRSETIVAAAMTRKLADTDKVVAIIGSVSTGMTLAMRHETKSRGMALISPSATSPKLGREGDGVVRVLFDDEFQGEALASYITHELGFRKAAVLLNNRFEYSRSIADAFQRCFNREGGRVFVESYDIPLSKSEGYDFRPILKRIKAKQPDIVLIPSYPEDVSAILRQAQDVDLKARFCGGDAWHHESTMLSSGNFLEGAFYISVMNEDKPGERAMRFEEMLNKSNYEADIVSGQGYDAMSILLEALKSGPTRKDILKGVYGIRDFPLVTGNITIDRKKGSLKPAYIVEVVKEDNDFVRKVVSVIEPQRD